MAKKSRLSGAMRKVTFVQFITSCSRFISALSSNSSAKHAERLSRIRTCQTHAPRFISFRFVQWTYYKRLRFMVLHSTQTKQELFLSATVINAAKNNHLAIIPCVMENIYSYG